MWKLLKEWWEVLLYLFSCMHSVLIKVKSSAIEIIYMCTSDSQLSEFSVDYSLDIATLMHVWWSKECSILRSTYPSYHRSNSTVLGNKELWVLLSSFCQRWRSLIVMKIHLHPSNSKNVNISRQLVSSCAVVCCVVCEPYWKENKKILRRMRIEVVVFITWKIFWEMEIWTWRRSKTEYDKVRIRIFLILSLSNRC